MSQLFDRYRNTAGYGGTVCVRAVMGTMPPPIWRGVLPEGGRKFFVDTTKTFVVIIVFVKRMPQKPTASELTVLHVLWGRGPSTVREVHEALSEEKHVGYTSVLKVLQIMTAKGLVRRNESQRAHVYEACLPAEQTKRQLAGDILQRVFEGSASQLMMHALAGRKGSREEIDELRRLLDEYERRRR